MSERIQTAIDKAMNGESGLSNRIRIEAQSSSKVRMFLNNLCNCPGTRYLEIGVWRGSTFVSALYGNEDNVDVAVAIDTCEGLPDHKPGPFLEACEKYLREGSYTFIHDDAFKVNPGSLPGPFNVYFFDGPHDELSQYRAFSRYNRVLTDTFIAIVDDWNHPAAKTGTRKVFEDLCYDVEWEVELPATKNGDLSNWWNGLYVALVSKG